MVREEAAEFSRSATRPPGRGTLVAAGNALRIAAATLLAHRLRSTLTVLGIVIGIAAVVLVGAAIQGLNDYAVATTTQAFGSNTFLVSQVASLGSLSRKELADKLRKNPEIERREAETLAAATAGAVRIAPSLQAMSDVKAGNRTFLAASVTGSTANLEVIRDIRISRGRFFNDEENRRSQLVVVLGQDIVDELFPSVDPLGKQVRIQGRLFSVVGVQEKQGSSFGASLDRYVWMPLCAFEKLWGTRRSLTLFVQPKDGVTFDDAHDETRMQLRTIRRLRPGASDNFDVLTPEAGRSFVARLTGLIAVAIVPISSVALFVAGIVVMNMMLVSVTERTREIGVRKSIGARRRDIYAQIIFESTLLTVAGGGIGIFLSWLGTIGLSRAFGTPVSIPTSYLVLAVAVSAVTGLGAGLYPAYVASKMPPTEALRAET
jgi:putative ABC transport system permease protein